MKQQLIDIASRDPASGARTGQLRLAHGQIDTPVFMPVGTRGSVKGLFPGQLREAGTQMILANTYHLALRPGPEIVADLGGLHRFMAWDGPILTDSGGFQIFSLATLTALDDDGVTFKSHIDGAPIRLDPAGAIRIQEQLGADVIMVLDECVALPAEPSTLLRAVQRTIHWAKACHEAHTRNDQALFAIIQGGLDFDLRCRCLDELVAMDFPGYAVGGLSVGENPEDRPRYLMGVGRPIDIIRAVAAGIDMFDCVMPTRNGRNSFAFTDTGVLRLRNSCHRSDERPLEEGCDCPACRHFTRAYLRHLFLAGEMLGPILVSLHNIAYYQRFMRRIRTAIAGGTFAGLLAEYEAKAVAEENKDQQEWVS